MTEMVTSGSMSGERKRSDGLLGESDYERRRLRQAPPVLHATASLLDSTCELGGHPVPGAGLLLRRDSVVAELLLSDLLAARG